MGHDSSARLVLITGASRGIGSAAAIEFARRGDRVVAVARDRERLDALAAGHSSVVPVPADVTDATSMQAMVRRVQQQCGVPDVLVVDGSISLSFPETATLEEQRRHRDEDAHECRGYHTPTVPPQASQLDFQP